MRQWRHQSELAFYDKAMETIDRQALHSTQVFFQKVVR